MEECTYIYEVKPNAESVPLNESVYQGARLVCPGDKGYVKPAEAAKNNKSTVDEILPNLILE
ncbi:hypothetical protein BH11CYA1_BH11CYA1_49570 [soil metagenome]